jgi:hypothetical protein
MKTRYGARRPAQGALASIGIVGTLAGCSTLAYDHLGETSDLLYKLSDQGQSSDEPRKFYEVRYGNDSVPQDPPTLEAVYLNPAYRAALETGAAKNGFTRVAIDRWVKDVPRTTRGDWIYPPEHLTLTFASVAQGATVQPRYSSRPLTAPGAGFMLTIVQSFPKGSKLTPVSPEPTP